MKRLLCMFLLGWILFRSRHWYYLRQLTITTQQQQGDVEKRRRNDLVRGASCTPYAVVVGITLRLSVSGLDSLSIIHARTHLMSLVNEGGCITILFLCSCSRSFFSFISTDTKRWRLCLQVVVV